ncbi:MAG: hypothetical protein PHE06_04840 [Lachnospiraceae bacterium]|nr:hypothetical protein [Lachnospiraceae bacterium]
MNKRPSFRKKIRYWFDRLMGKGTIALVGMLFLVTAIVVLIAGVLGSICSGDLSAGKSIWQSLMHAIDAGTLGGDDTANLGFVVLMSMVTLCGIFVTSILISIISSGFEEKLNSLRKGFSVVIEQNHTVIIGFNEGIYTLLSELIEANSNQKRGCILVIGEQDKEYMEEEIKAHIDNFKTTEIICRSGNFTNNHILEMASVETARSIIINQQDDFNVIKALLATVAYLKLKDAFDNDAHITTLIHDEGNMDAVKIAGEGKAEVIYLTDILARIIAHTCRQPGMSLVLTDFFDFDGDEFYFEEFPELMGKTFGSILNCFVSSVVVGIERNDALMLNPPMDTVIESGDRIIHLAEDDGISVPKNHTPELQMDYEQKGSPANLPYHLLILGYNASLPIILHELDQYVADGSTVVLACPVLTDGMQLEEAFTHLQFSARQCNIYNKGVLMEMLADGITDVLLLNQSADGAEGAVDKGADEADSKTLLLLLQLRDIASRKQLKFNITSEMHSVENQRLSRVAKVNDFVVGSTIANLILTQVSENRELAALFEDILDADGSEIYMKPASSYVQLGRSVNIYTLTEIARKRSEIVVGYKTKDSNGLSIVLNPVKDTFVTFTKEDYLIVIAED